MCDANKRFQEFTKKLIDELKFQFWKQSLSLLSKYKFWFNLSSTGMLHTPTSTSFDCSTKDQQSNVNVETHEIFDGFRRSESNESVSGSDLAIHPFNCVEVRLHKTVWQLYSHFITLLKLQLRHGNQRFDYFSHNRRSSERNSL